MFEILEHPADIGFRARAATLEELFAASAMAMLSIAGDPETVEPAGEYAIQVESGDLESLLVDWLSEVLYFFDGRRIAFREFRLRYEAPARLWAVGRGEPRDPARHTARVIVKAVTYHQLKIAQDSAGWMAEVYLDI